MLVSRSIAILVLVCGCTAPRVESAGADARIPVLIIGGVNNHDWARTTAAVRATLERTRRFTVDVSTSPDEGLSGRHGRIREFQVIHDRPDHPILAGLPTTWMHAADELYASLRGPAGASLDCTGFQTALARGTEYAATGEVTIGVPAAFPGPDEPSVVPPERLEWPM